MTSSPRTINSCLEFLHQKLTRYATPLLIVALSVLMPQMASAGAWTLGKGQVWSKITYMSLSTNEHYDNDGNAGEIPARYKSQQLYFDVYYGLNDRIDVGIKIPYISNEFVDVSPDHPFSGAPDKKDSGIGDIRGVAKINLVNSADLVGTLKLGFKAPMGEYREVPEALSITGGQWDFDVVAQLGGPFGRSRCTAMSIWDIVCVANTQIPIPATPVELIARTPRAQSLFLTPKPVIARWTNSSSPSNTKAS